MKRLTVIAIVLITGCSTVKPPVVPPTATPSAAVPVLPQRSTPRTAISTRAFAIVPPPVSIYSTNITVVATVFSQAYGIPFVWYAGNRSGQYTMSLLSDASGTNTFTNLDSRLPYFFYVNFYHPAYPPWTNTTANGRTHVQPEYEWTESIPELMWYSTNLQPYVTVQGSNAVLTGYGTLGTTYSVASGATLDTLTPLTAFQGSNALYSVVDAATAAKFYSVKSQ